MKRAVKNYPGLYKENYGKSGNRYRILINHNKQQIQEYFSFSYPADQNKTKLAAMKRWRQLREKYPVLTKRGFRELARRTSDSGLIGVRRIIKTNNENEYVFWASSWTDKKGRRKTRSFSVNQYSEKGAKKLAIEARNKGLDEMS